MQGQQRALYPVPQCFISFEIGFNERNGVAMKSKTKKKRKGKVTQKMSPTKLMLLGNTYFARKGNMKRLANFHQCLYLCVARPKPMVTAKQNKHPGWKAMQSNASENCQWHPPPSNCLANLPPTTNPRCRVQRPICRTAF